MDEVQIDKTKVDLLPCPLCRCPHINIARDLKGEVQQAFCKACRCSAPLVTWNNRFNDVAPLKEVLQEAAEQFEFYAREQRAKAERQTSGVALITLTKAEINETFAAMCRKACV